MKNFVIDANKLLKRCCILNHNDLLSYDIEINNDMSVVGNIYKGRVTYVDIVKGFGFVDIGLKKQGIINFSDVKDTIKLHAGSDVLVEVISDPYMEKGAKLSAELSFAGKFMVLYTLGNRKEIKISKKITDMDIRMDLEIYFDKLLGNKNIGVIVRTSSKDALKEELNDEFLELYSQMCEVLKYNTLGNSPKIIRENMGILSEYIKLFDVEKDIWITNDKNVYEYLVHIYNKKLVKYYSSHDLFDFAKCKHIVDKLKKRKFPVANGGELVIDYTEACTIIDVNSGKKKASQSVESIYDINIEAIKEIKWFIEKANLSGAIVVDIINMRRDKMLKFLKETKTVFKNSDIYIAGISNLGFLELTRKRKQKPLHQIFEYKLLYNDDCYTPNILYDVLGFINEIRRMKSHYNSNEFKFLVTDKFYNMIFDESIILENNQFYEDKDITVNLVIDKDLDKSYKISY